MDLERTPLTLGCGQHSSSGRVERRLNALLVDSCRPIPAVRDSLLRGWPHQLDSVQTAISIGVTSLKMALALTFSAIRRSYADCRFSQPCASLPK